MLDPQVVDPATSSQVAALARPNDAVSRVFFAEDEDFDGAIEEDWPPGTRADNASNLKFDPAMPRLVDGTPSGVSWHSMHRALARDSSHVLAQYYYDSAGWHSQKITVNGLVEPIN